MNATALRPATGAALEASALHAAQQRALFNPSPECDSLAERLIALREHGVPNTVLRGLIADVRAVIELNAREGRCERAVCVELEQLGRSLDGAAGIPEIAQGAIHQKKDGRKRDERSPTKHEAAPFHERDGAQQRRGGEHLIRS